MIGNKSERINHFHRLAKIQNQVPNCYLNDCETQFRIYLSQIEVPVTFEECWREFTKFHPKIPQGKGKWSQLLCAIIILDRLRKRMGPALRIRPILAKWEVNRGDYFAALRALQSNVKITSYASSSMQNDWGKGVKNYFFSLSHELAIDPSILALAQKLILAKRLINRLEIQAAGAILAAMDILANKSAIPICDILAYFHPISLERIYALKKQFVERWEKLDSQSPKHTDSEVTREPIVEEAIPSIRADQQESFITTEKQSQKEPKQPMLPPFRRPNPFIVWKRKIIIFIQVFFDYELPIISFVCIWIIVFYGRKIGITDQMFPPPGGKTKCTLFFYHNSSQIISQEVRFDGYEV